VREMPVFSVQYLVLDQADKKARLDAFVFLAEISPSGPNKVATWYPECKRESPVFLYVQRGSSAYPPRGLFREKRNEFKEPVLAHIRVKVKRSQKFVN
jgi:hypothetical protein